MTALQGCTPGFWKQPKHFVYWTSPYTPATLIGGVFTGAVGYQTDKDGKPIADQTLLYGLGFKGGSSPGGAAEILLRAGTAALLNAANPNVNYARPITEIITSVNVALASGDRTAILTLGSALDADNNGQCTAK